jgi:hypothetical protein
MVRSLNSLGRAAKRCGCRAPEAAGLTNGVVSAAGLGFGALASSAAVQLLPAPRILPYVTVFVLFGVDLVGVIFMPEPIASPSRLRLTPQRPQVPPSVRQPFIVAALAVIAAYSIGGLFFALGPALSARLFGTGNHLLTGLSLFLLAGVGSLAQLAYGRRAPWLGATAGSVALGFGVALIVFAAAGIPPRRSSSARWSPERGSGSHSWAPCAPCRRRSHPPIEPA